MCGPGWSISIWEEYRSMSCNCQIKIWQLMQLDLREWWWRCWSFRWSCMPLITDVYNKVMMKECIPSDSRKRLMMNVYKAMIMLLRMWFIPKNKTAWLGAESFGESDKARVKNKIILTECTLGSVQEKYTWSYFHRSTDAKVFSKAQGIMGIICILDL
jgi:hypothetical protein